VLVRLAEVPEPLLLGLLAVEDRHFSQHPGIDPGAILRAALANLRAGRIVQGGSTLTQQLVKNLFLDSDRTFRRKFDEALMALLLEWHYDKTEILETYLNEVYLGQQGGRAIHGFGLASAYYFGKPLGELEIQELALLVGMVKGPTYYHPLRRPERARARAIRCWGCMPRRDCWMTPRFGRLRPSPWASGPIFNAAGITAQCWAWCAISCCGIIPPRI